MVIVRDDLLEKVPENLPVMLDYRLMVAKNSLYNTPPSFSIYMLGLVLNWLLELGGLEEIARLNIQKAAQLYQAIDQSDDFFHGHCKAEHRSLMNVTFRTPSEEFDQVFVQSAAEKGLIGLKGHRSVGGLRASIYNACSIKSVEVLVEFMLEFQREYR